MSNNNKKKKSKAILFNLTAFMNEKGDVELEVETINPDDYVRVMESGLPEYEGTYKVASLVRYLKSMGDEILEKSGRYV